MEHTTVGARIRACRLARGVTASALAACVGITENAIRKIEAGNSKEPRFSTGVRIADALGVDPKVLIDSRIEAPPTSVATTLQRIRACKNALERLGVAHASIFGSVARGEATTASDVDVMLEPIAGNPFTLFDLAGAQQVLERALGVPVDVVTAASLQKSSAGRHAQEEAVRAF